MVTRFRQRIIGILSAAKQNLMVPLYARLAAPTLHKDLGPYVFSLALFLVSMFYTRLRTSVIEWGGHEFVMSAMCAMKAEGQLYFSLLYTKRK